MYRPDQNPNKEPTADPIIEPKVITIDDLTQTKDVTVSAPPNASQIQENDETTESE